MKKIFGTPIKGCLFFNLTYIHKSGRIGLEQNQKRKKVLHENK